MGFFQAVSMLELAIRLQVDVKNQDRYVTWAYASVTVLNIIIFLLSLYFSAKIVIILVNAVKECAGPLGDCFTAEDKWREFMTFYGRTTAAISVTLVIFLLITYWQMWR